MWGEIIPIRALQTAGIFCLGQAVYCSLFAALMLVIRRWFLRQVTVVFYSRILALRWLDLSQQTADDWKGRWGLDLKTAPSVTYAVLALTGFALAVLIVSVLWFNRMEFSMKTPEGN